MSSVEACWCAGHLIIWISKADDALDILEMVAGLIMGGDDEEEEEEEAEPDDEDGVDPDETATARKRRLRHEQAHERARKKEQRKEKQVLKKAQPALDAGSLEGVADMQGVMKEVVTLMEGPLHDATKSYKEFLCGTLTSTLLEVSS